MGLYWYDRYKAIFESLINLVVSVILAIPYGIVGIFIGTFVSTMTTCFWIEPYMLFKHGFHANVGAYFRKYGLHTLYTVIIGAGTWYLASLLPELGFLPFVGKLFICAIVPNLCYWLIYGRTEEFRYAVDLLKSRLGAILKR